MAWLFVLGMVIGGTVFAVAFKYYVAYGEEELRQLHDEVTQAEEAGDSWDRERIMDRLLSIPRVAVDRNHSTYEDIWQHIEENGQTASAPQSEADEDPESENHRTFATEHTKEGINFSHLWQDGSPDYRTIKAHASEKKDQLPSLSDWPTKWGEVKIHSQFVPDINQILTRHDLTTPGISGLVEEDPYVLEEDPYVQKVMDAITQSTKSVITSIAIAFRTLYCRRKLDHTDDFKLLERGYSLT